MADKIVASNWKMHKDVEESVEFAKKLKDKVQDINDTEVMVGPPYTSLYSMGEILSDSQITMAAQNMHFEDSGAFTGEISAKMINSTNSDYVILGHSERRHVFNESNETIRKKVEKAYEADIDPIVCVGEELEDRKAGNTAEILEEQYKSAFEGISKENFSKAMIAYEPVWAIGTGESATPEQAGSSHEIIRNFVEEQYDAETAQNLTIMYGGSVKPWNAEELIQTDDIDGFLVGSASLEVKSFYEIIEKVENYIN